MSHPDRGRTPLVALLAVAALLAAVVLLIFASSGEPEVPPAGGGGLENSVEEASPGPARLSGPAVERSEAQPVRTTVEGPMVLASRVSGLVINHRGEPVGDVKVLLTPRIGNDQVFLPGDEANFALSWTYVQRTDPSGRYLFDQLPLDKVFDMWLYHPAYAPTQGIPVTPIKGEDQEMMPIALRDGFRIHGAIVDTGGNPLAAQVELHLQVSGFRGLGEKEAREQDQAYGRLLLLQTGNDGLFDARNLAEGIWEVKARAEGYADGTLPQPIPLFSPDGEKEVRIEMGTEYVLGGVVVDEEDKPVPFASIYAGRTSPRPIQNYRGEADENGEFLLRGLNQGLYGVHVMAPGFSNARKLRVKPTQVDLKFVMQRKGGVAGRVLDPGGSPVPRFTLELRRIHRSTTMYNYTGVRKTIENDNGDYLLGDIDPGDFILQVRASGFSPTWSPGFRVDREVVRGVDIQLKRGGTLAGYVYSSATGGPLPGAEVILRGQDYEDLQMAFGGPHVDPDNVPLMLVKAGQDGSFRMEHAYPGPAKLELRHPTHLHKYVYVTVEEGVETDVGSHHLSPGGTVTGRALDGRGRPLAGGMVYLSRKPGDGPYFGDARTVDARGRFRFDALPAGVYQLAASAYDADGFGGLFQAEDSMQEIIVQEGQTYEVDIFVGG